MKGQLLLLMVVSFVLNNPVGAVPEAEEIHCPPAKTRSQAERQRLEALEREFCESLLSCPRNPRSSKWRCSGTAIGPGEAWRQTGKICTVEYVVDNIHLCRKGHLYLNESRNFKHSFAAVIPLRSRKHFPSTLARQAKSKTVRVAGKIEMICHHPEIIVDYPQQLTILLPAATRAAKK